MGDAVRPIAVADVRHRRNVAAALQIVHGGGHAAHDALIVDVDLHIAPQVGAARNLGEDGLPGLDLVAVSVRFIIRVGKNSPLLQIEHVPADIVEALIHIVAVAAVGHHRRVADRGEHAAHGSVLLLGKITFLRDIEMIGVVEDEVHLLHQLVRHDKHHIDHQRQADDQEDALETGADDLTHGLLLPAVDVKHLLDDRPDGEAEGKGNADERHRPVDVCNNAVFEKHVDEVIRLAVVGNAHDAREHLEHGIELIDDPAHCDLRVIQELEDRRVEDRFQHRGQRVSQPVLKSAENAVQHAVRPPFCFFFGVIIRSSISCSSRSHTLSRRRRT